MAIDLSKSDRTRITVLNALGQEVSVLADGPLASGPHRIAMPVTTLSSGVYLVRMQQGIATQVVRFMVK